MNHRQFLFAVGVLALWAAGAAAQEMKLPELLPPLQAPSIGPAATLPVASPSTTALPRAQQLGAPSALQPAPLQLAPSSRSLITASVLEDKNGDKGSGKNGNGNGKGNGNGNGDEGPKHIRDNGQLVEEASNQEAGVVQHIFNWVTLWDFNARGRTRDFGFSYTMELPLGSQKHQFSFTTLFLTSFDDPVGGPVTQQGDVGDTLLNYRYQLLGEGDEPLWCAPRFSLILPTGDERFGQGKGQLGYLFNLPISWYGETFDFHFNLGGILIPGVSLPLDAPGQATPRRDLRTVNLGGAVYWKPKENLHFFVETLALWLEDINDLGRRESQNQLFLNPGFRYAICQLDQVEWVIGVGVPIGLTRDTPDIGVFAYMSVEHDFCKKKKEKKNGDD